MKVPQVIVVGGGIAGSAAALRAAQYHLDTLWIFGDAKTANRSRAQWVVNIDNMIGLHEGIIKKKLLKKFKGEEHAAAREIIETNELEIGTRDIIDNTRDRLLSSELSPYVTIVDEAAVNASRDGDHFLVETTNGKYRAPFLVVATGVMDRQPLIKKMRGDELADDPKWIYPFSNRETVLYCIRCEGHLTSGTATAVIGSSEDAAQVALMLYERYQSTCCILTNGEKPGWSETTQKLIDAYQLGVRTARITDIEGRKGQMNAITLEDGGRAEVLFALVSMGLFRVYNELPRALGATLTDPEQAIEVRHVQIDAKSETSVANLFAVGDMTRRPEESVMKQVYTCQEYAVRAVDTIDRRVRKARRDAVLAKKV